MTEFVDLTGAMLPGELGPNGELPAYLPERTIATLSEQIAIAALDLRDPNGLRVWTKGDVTTLEDIALEAVAKFVEMRTFKLREN